MAKSRSYRDLEVWQRSMELAVDLHRLTLGFPIQERFGLTSQLNRAIQSVPNNIAEGQGRLYRGDFLRHASMARGSLFEAETQLDLARRLGYLPDAEFEAYFLRFQEVGRLLNGLVRFLQKSD
jgi:four helix bundle protein